MRRSKDNPELNFKQLSKIVKQLSPSEKMKLNDVIWDDDLGIPEEHQKLVLGRLKKSKQSAGHFIAYT